MKNNKFDEAGKSKVDQQVVATLSSSVKQIRHVADTNQQKLQQLELAIANLTTICSAIRHDMYSLSSSSSSSNQGSLGKSRAEVVDCGSRSCSPRLDSKNGVLGVQMQQLVKQAAALGIHKDSNTNSIKFSGKTKEESKTPTKAVRKNVQVSKNQASKNQKSSTKSLIQRKQSTTGKTTCMKLETVNNNNMGATQPKAKRAPENSSGAGNNNMMKAHNTTDITANVSLKSTIKRTKTTVSKVYVNQSAANKSKKDTAAVKNGETAQGKGQKISPKNHGLTYRSSSSSAADSEIRHPRRKWGTAKEITLTNSK